MNDLCDALALVERLKRMHQAESSARKIMGLVLELAILRLVEAGEDVSDLHVRYREAMDILSDVR